VLERGSGRYEANPQPVDPARPQSVGQTDVEHVVEDLVQAISTSAFARAAPTHRCLPLANPRWSAAPLKPLSTLLSSRKMSKLCGSENFVSSRLAAPMSPPGMGASHAKGAGRERRVRRAAGRTEPDADADLHPIHAEARGELMRHFFDTTDCGAVVVGPRSSTGSTGR
jgi:hypothetical protein